MCIEQSEPAPLDECGERPNDRALQQIDSCGGQAAEYNVARQPPQLRFRLLAQRAAALECRQCGKRCDDDQRSETADAAHDVYARAVAPRVNCWSDAGDNDASARRASSMTSGAVANVAAAAVKHQKQN